MLRASNCSGSLHEMLSLRSEGMKQLLGRFTILLCLASFATAKFHPLSETDKLTAQNLFDLSDLTAGSLEKTYQALRSLRVLQRIPENITCESISPALTSSAEEPKHVFFAVRITGILGCQLENGFMKVATSNLISSLKQAASLYDFYYSIGALAEIKKQHSLDEVLNLEDALKVFNGIKVLGQSDGTWRFISAEGKPSLRATGIALETFAGLFSLAGSHLQNGNINQVIGIVSKIFENIESYDDGSQYFDDTKVDLISEDVGRLAASSTIVRGVLELAAVVPKQLKIETGKFLGLANYFLSIGIPWSSEEAYYALDALGYLESNSFIIPVVLSFPYSVLSLNAKDLLKVTVTTVLGSAVPAKVTLASARKAGLKGKPLLVNQALEFVPDSSFYKFDLVSRNLDTGKYDLTFNVELADKEKYLARSPIATRILVSSSVSFANVEVGVLDSDTGSAEFVKTLNPSAKEAVTLSANHLQKLYISFDVLSPFGEPFIPHQVFLKFVHESGLEHLFLIKASGKKFKLTLDFLGLVDKFFYLSGLYKLELTVGDDILENPLLWSLGTVELDLPEPPEGAPKPPAAAKDVRSLYGPKPEITHVFRQPEKRPPSHLSDSFLVFTLLPLLGFLIGIHLLGVNMKGMPSSGLPFILALSFHGGIAGVLGIYLAFWLKLTIFTTLKYLGVVAIFLFFTGHHLLSFLANSTSKVKVN